MDAVDAIWNEGGDAGVAIYSILRERVLRIRSIAIWSDEKDGFGLEYELIPAYDPIPPEGFSPQERAKFSARNRWWLSGLDDLGTEYEAPSGACGPSPAGMNTQGILDVYPQPPADATWLDLTFHGVGEPEESAGHHRFVLRVNLPLRVLTDEEIAKKKGMTESELVAMMDAVHRMQRESDERSKSED